MDFRGQTEPRNLAIAGVVSDGRIPLPCKEEGRTERVSLNRGWYRGFFENSSPTEFDLSVGDYFLLTKEYKLLFAAVRHPTLA